MAKLIIHNIVLLFICHNKRSSSREDYLEMAKSERRNQHKPTAPPSLYRLETNPMMAYVKVAIQCTMTTKYT